MWTLPHFRSIYYLSLYCYSSYFCWRDNLFTSTGWDCVSELRPPSHLPRWYEYGAPRWNDIDRGNPKNLEKTCPSATLSITNPTWTEPGANPGLRGKTPATNRLSHGTANMYLVFCVSVSRPASLLASNTAVCFMTRYLSFMLHGRV
jgi:hypothetical protein